MLRIFNFTRNVGSHVIRTSLRENDQPKSRLIPPNQFLFWFNEIPGQFSPSPALQRFLALEGHAGSVNDRSLAPCVDFSQHKEDEQKFDVRSLTYMRALHYGALLAVGYTILHNKLLSNIVREACQPYCPILSIKHQKTVLAQPLSLTDVNVSRDCRVLKLTDDKEVNSDDLTTSDYSSTKSEFEPPLEFTLEEEELMNLEMKIPDKIELLSQAITNVKKGAPEGMKVLEDLANGGCPIGLFYLGQVYEHGVKTRTNKAKARALYEEAASLGSAEAKYNLGLFYLRGEAGQRLCPEERRLRAHSLLTQAAKEGLAEARESLSRGQFDRTELRELKQGDLDELVRIGTVLEENVLCDMEDKFIALDYYRVASERGHKAAQIRLRTLSKSLQTRK